LAADYLHDIAETQKLLHPFAPLMENFTHRELVQILLETYLGRKTGTRVLQGQIQRGDGWRIDAVVNEKRRAAKEKPFRCGVSLHLGRLELAGVEPADGGARAALRR